jgi:hypothetical protein
MTVSPPRFREDPAADAARLLLRLGIAVLALALPTLSLLSRRTVFIVFPIGALLTLIAALLRGGVLGLDRWRGPILSAPGIAALFLIGWAALSLAWTPFRAEAGDHLLKAAGTALLAAAAAASLPRTTRSSDLYLVPIGVAAGAGLALVLGLTQTAPAEPEMGPLARGIVTLMVLVWPALAALGARRHWGLAILLMLAVAAGAALIWSPMVLIALAAGAFAFAAARTELRQVARSLGVLAALICVFAPLVPIAADALFALRGAESTETVDVFSAWAHVVTSDPARLMTGHGLDAAVRSLQAGFLSAAVPRGLLFEIWYDLGLLGALGLAGLLFLCFDAAGRSGEGVGPALAGGLAAIFTLAIVGQQTTQIWWLTLLAVAAVESTIVVRGEYRTKRPLARLEISDH